MMGCTSHLLQAFVYRRVQSSQPLRSWSGPCGVIVHERLLLPNLGNEGAVFMVGCESEGAFSFCFHCKCKWHGLAAGD